MPKVELGKCPKGFCKSADGTLVFVNWLGDAYIISAGEEIGEHFWGGAETYGESRKVLVEPISYKEAAEYLKQEVEENERISQD